MPDTTTAVRLHATGGPEALRLEQIPLAAPGPQEAVVRHTHIGVNFIDTYHRSGLYAVPSLPSGLGSEAACVVEQVGPGVTQFKIGDRAVYATGPLGAYSERRVIPIRHLVSLPPEIESEIAAAMLLKGMTVEYLIRRCFPVSSGQTVLFHAAAGGVGSIACQWLSHLGVRVIGTVGSDEKATLARANGAAEVINYARENFVSRVRELTGGKGVPVVFDAVGKSTFEGSLDCLSPRGTLVSFGNASGKPPLLDVITLSQKGSLYVTRPTLNAYAATREELVASAEALFDVVRTGKVKIQVGKRFALSEAAAAHTALETRATTGSTVLIPNAS